VPSYGSEWFWHNYQCTGDGPGSVKAFADKNFPQVGSDYPQYADMFHAELFEAADWVTAIKGSGAQYVLPVAKHHDGFCMWDARDTAPMWNAAQVGPQRDVLTELCGTHLSPTPSHSALLAPLSSLGLAILSHPRFFAPQVQRLRRGRPAFRDLLFAGRMVR